MSCNGRVWTHNFSEGMTTGDKCLDFLYIRMSWQAVKVQQIIEFYGDFYIVLSSSGELEEMKLLPVALTTSITCDLHWWLHFFSNIAE